MMTPRLRPRLRWAPPSALAFVVVLAAALQLQVAVGSNSVFGFESLAGRDHLDFIHLGLGRRKPPSLPLEPPQPPPPPGEEEKEEEESRGGEAESKSQLSCDEYASSSASSSVSSVGAASVADGGTGLQRTRAERHERRRWWQKLERKGAVGVQGGLYPDALGLGAAHVGQAPSSAPFALLSLGALLGSSIDFFAGGGSAGAGPSEPSEHGVCVPQGNGVERLGCRSPGCSCTWLTRCFPKFLNASGPARGEKAPVVDVGVCDPALWVLTLWSLVLLCIAVLIVLILRFLAVRWQLLSQTRTGQGHNAYPNPKQHRSAEAPAKATPQAIGQLGAALQ